MTGGVIANLSRSIFVLYPFSSFISNLSLLWNKKKYLLLIIIGLGVTIYGAIHYYPEITQRLVTITNTKTDLSNLGRIYVWKSAIAMFKDHRYFGVGLGDFAYLYALQYRSPHEVQFLQQPHNIFLTIAAESGISGLIGLGTFILYFLYSFCKGAFFHKNKYDMLMLSIFLSYICLFGLIDFPLHLSEGMRWFWATMGVIYALKELSKRDVVDRDTLK